MTRIDLKSNKRRHLCLQRACSSGEQGFTLVELLVSIGIFSVIMAGMFSFLWGVSAHWQTGQEIADATENARLGLNRMTRELRQASMITAADSTSVSFNVDFGGGQETITYTYTPGSETDGIANGTVWRTSTTSSGQVALVDGVESIQFSYFGNNYRCDANADGIIAESEIYGCSGSPLREIAEVDITLVMNAGDRTSKTFDAQAWLRNRLETQNTT